MFFPGLHSLALLMLLSPMYISWRRSTSQWFLKLGVGSFLLTPKKKKRLCTESIGQHASKLKAWLPAGLRDCCISTKLELSWSRSQARATSTDRRGLHKAGRWEQGVVDKGKLPYKNRLEKSRSCPTGKATNTGYCAQEHTGVSLGSGHQGTSSRAHRSSTHLPTPNTLCAPQY